LKMLEVRGDLSVEDAYAMLAKTRVRRWSTCAHSPNGSLSRARLAALGKKAIFRQWQVYPAMEVATDFVPGLVDDWSDTALTRQSSNLHLSFGCAFP